MMRRAAYLAAPLIAAAGLVPYPVSGDTPAREVASRPARGPECRQVIRVVVDKSDRRLWADCASGAVLAMPVSFGRAGPEPKRRAGDRATPEGYYRATAAARESRFHLFIPLDYPSPGDARRAFAEGRIGAEDHARIQRAHEEGRPPPADTPLGGHIGLHGRGARWQGVDPELDWTLGCVALSDDDVERLAERLAPGTPVVIRP